MTNLSNYQIYYPNSSGFLGNYSGSNPNSVNGQWWYRTDTGQILQNINGNIIPITTAPNTLIISSNQTIGSVNVPTVVNQNVVVLPNTTLTLMGTIIFNGTIMVSQGGTILSSNPQASAGPTNNYYYFLQPVYLNGTYNIASNNIDVISYSQSITTASGPSSPTISGSGTLHIPNGITLTINANINLSVNAVVGKGTLSISSGYTITINSNSSFSIANISGSLVIASSYTLTIGANTKLSVATISGTGTLLIASGYTLTQESAVTISISNISVAGTWANAGYGITIPSGATVSWSVSGSITTGSTAGTLTVNGTCYWIGSGITAATSNAQATFTLSLAGTGIFIGAPAGTGTGTTAISLSATAIGVGAGDGSASGTGYIPYYSFSSQAIQGSAVGQYTIGTQDATATTYQGFVLIYIGTASTNYIVSGNFGYTAADVSGNTIEAFNMTDSAGSITLTGSLYV